MPEKSRYKQVIEAVEKNFQRGESTNWRNKDFDDLSKAIFSTSHILISSATLKRIFGKVQTAKDYYPQESTLDALELYANTIENEFTKSQISPIENSNNSGEKKSILKSNQSYVKAAVLIFTMSIIVALIFIYFYKQQQTAHLVLLKKEGDYPATFYFETKISHISDSVFFDKGDNSKPVYLNKNTKKFNAYFSRPGVYYAKLICNKKEISNITTCIVYTNEWYASVNYFNHDINASIQVNENKKDSCLNFSLPYLSSINLDTNRLINLQLENIKSTGVNGDNFKSEFVIRNPKTKEPSLCRSTAFELLGTEGNIKFNLVYPGCSYWLGIKLSEKNFKAIDYDVSGFTVDLSKWKKINITNSNKNVSITLDGNKIFESNYHQSIGEIVGINILFNGLGMVKSIKASSLDSKKTFFEY